MLIYHYCKFKTSMGRPLESLLKHYQLPNLSQRKREQEKRWQNTDVHGLTHPFAAYLWILIPKLLKLRMELTLLLVYQTNNIAWIFRIVFQQKTCNYKELLSSLHRLVRISTWKWKCCPYFQIVNSYSAVQRELFHKKILPSSSFMF